MATKKTKKVTEELPVVEKKTSLVVGPETKDGVMHFSTNDLLRFELAQSKVQQAHQQLKIIQADLEIIKNNFEGLARKNQQQQSQALAELRSAEKNLETLRNEVARVYNIDLSKITYDDVSGAIFFPPDPVDEGTSP